MFTLYNILTNIKSVLYYRNNLVIGSGKGGIVMYNEDSLIKLSSISPDYACIFNNHLLFQKESGSSVYYQRLDELQSAVGTIKGRFFLYNYQEDNMQCYLPGRNLLFEFDEHLQPTGSYKIKSIPNGVWNGKQYHMYPHMSCFSLQDQVPIWKVENDEQLIRKITLRDKYFSIKNEVVILRSPFTDNANYLTGLDAATGTMLWQHRDYMPDMTFIDGNIYVYYYLTKPPLEGRLLIIDTKTGNILKDLDLTEELTRRSFRLSDHYHLAKQGAYLYIAATYNKSVHILNIETGRIEWSHKVDTKADWLTGITVTDNNLFVTDQLDVLHIFKRS
ncbi:PQQ-like domain-containing protein [Chitinophaga sp. CF118]|uniref:outer membrane protein assembly factor BamB family protein n=1 Tax=Chitinophaga sp. CF118 TaxID=1884367 RepID=UPI0008E52D62|nr:PQQ-binding-like beta-propeller repeat protein [Chitinophaga sp. CF118]SFE58872.1 PQQ-like domain-containing protein [Chitinophaga sp. CF118]